MRGVQRLGWYFDHLSRVLGSSWFDSELCDLYCLSPYYVDVLMGMRERIPYWRMYPGRDQIQGSAS